MKTAKNLRNTYNELKEVFEKLNYKVVLDKGNFNTGYCLLEHEKIIVVNKNKPYENRVKILSYRTLDLSLISLSLFAKAQNSISARKTSGLEQKTS